ncbi:coniferyl alcohol acyltransferase-like [Cornus florida]|uniref:coniferyl alcohol acyltransferase-like n=1 Tax=Cornus florida TaxID=4283 RepID=UPI00289D3DEF|nr:coniferyl alcohol acyltransferase-like [Cornus florida]
MDIAAKGGLFSVKLGRKEVVAAVVPMQEHWLPHSNLDLLLPPVDVCVFFCYKKTAADNFTHMVNVLKKALAQALVSYYAFAGELVQNTSGEPELLCNNRGVDFFEAYADVELQQLNLYNPDQSVEGKLVPKKKQGVLSVQATELKCGGLVVGCTFDHRVADAFSTNMFLVSWVEMAQSKSVLSLLPSFRRSLLNPRHPGHYDPSLDNMYVPISALPPPQQKKSGTPDDDHLISRIYYIEDNQLSHLQSLASAGGDRRSKLEAFSAFVWKVVAASTEHGNDKKCRMGIVVDGRTRLSERDSGEKAEMMSAYFGNVLSIPYGEKRIAELEERPLSWVANAVHECLEVAKTKQHFLELIDWVEAHRPEPALAKIYASSEDEGPGVVVSSGQRFPVSQMDFGWGKPVFGSYHFPWGGEAGYVMPMPSPVGNGDWVVYMHMLRVQLELIETQGAHLFKPLTSGYLNI